jgi:integrase
MRDQHLVAANAPLPNREPKPRVDELGQHATGVARRSPGGVGVGDTPQFRRSVATVVRDTHGAALAQQQLSHAKLSTTEAHYLERHTRGPDVRAALEKYAAGATAQPKIEGK